MIDRLLARFHTPRRHMAFLVGSLTLVLVLTAVIAWRANEADRQRVSVANAALTESAAIALGTWSSTYEDYAANMLFDMAADVANPELKLDSLRTILARLIRCQECRTDGLESIFVYDAAPRSLSSSGHSLPDGLIDSLQSRFDSGHAAVFHERIRGGLYLFEVGGDVTPVFAYLTLAREGGPQRITGAVLSAEMARQTLSNALTWVQKNLDAHVSPDLDEALFTPTAYASNVPFFGERSIPGAIETQVGSPVYGLKLAMSPRGSGLLTQDAGTAERTTLFVLMVIITALLITAMMQVRRDAMLTRVRADFVASVSHELRTPLAQIRMFTETLLLGRVRTDIERRRSLEIIDQEARRLAHLVENVLLFSKSEGGRRTRVAPEPMQFTDEIRRAVESLALLCRRRSAEIRTELQDGITVPVDGMALRQIMVNLVDNALKYGPTGQRITVGAALFDDTAHVWVDDEGPGIPAEERERVFESFHRLPRDVQSRISGSGIGLAVVRELAQLHGGRAWAESAPGGGARIIVQFPDAQIRGESTAQGMAAAS